MDILIRYGFSIEEIKNMIDSNPDINNVDDSVIYTLIDVLGYCGCLSNHIKNIFICNPFYLSRKVSDVKELINTLKNIGINNINILFDMNPYILSFDASDIKSIYDNKLKEGLTKEEIINLFNYNSFSII